MPRKRAGLSALIERIEVRFDQIDSHLRPLQLCALLNPPATPSQDVNDEEIELLSIELGALPGVDRHLMKVRSRKFALDSALEGDGFELSVPRQIRCRFQDGSPSPMTV